MIQEKRLKVRVYTKGRLHAKAYIFDYEVFDEDRSAGRAPEQGIAIVGSSNLTLAGLTHNTELNVVVHGNENHAELSEWFEALWDESAGLRRALMQELEQSWAVATVDALRHLHEDAVRAGAGPAGRGEDAGSSSGTTRSPKRWPTSRRPRCGRRCR